MSRLGYWCSACKQYVPEEQWAAHVLAEQGSPEKALVWTVRDLIQAGDGIRCYPSGAVGFDEWSDAMAAAEFVLGAFLDEDGNWHPMEESAAQTAARSDSEEPS